MRKSGNVSQELIFWTGINAEQRSLLFFCKHVASLHDLPVLEIQKSNNNQTKQALIFLWTTICCKKKQVMHIDSNGIYLYTLFIEQL